MAVYPKDRNKFGGDHDAGPRGGIRGSIRGRGRGKRKPEQGSKIAKKSTFQSTRIEDQAVYVSEDDKPGFGVESGEYVEEASESLSDSEDDLHNITIHPYNSLLQSLLPNVQRGAPQRKRRKLDPADALEAEYKAVDANLDEVEEPEEMEDLGIDDYDIDEQQYDYDPFLEHLDPKHEALQEKIQAIRKDLWSTNRPRRQLEWSYVFKTPQGTNDCPVSESDTVSSTEALCLKQKLRGPAKSQIPPFDDFTGNFASTIFHYRDVLFPCRSIENGEILRKLMCLHTLNHIFKTRDRIIKDNARLSREDAEEDIELRDQGFTRPKVLILLPTRNSCAKYLKTVISLCEPEQQENRKRFQDAYATGEPVSADKPRDFRELFDGNDNDMFRLGLKFTRKTVKFFAQFYNSDIILASPLGLRIALGAENSKKADTDFLSSIEIVVMDQADSMLMQNWEHVEHIFDHLNLQPKEAHGCDFSRVRDWYLDGNARYLRQTILLSAFNFPSLNKLYIKNMLNIAGKLKYSSEVDGALTKSEISLKQTFSRFDFGTPIAEPENRFKYFTTAVIPSLRKPSRNGLTRGQGVLIFLPSYADFVRVRNYMATSPATQDISFGSISEYTSARDVARARSHFLSGRHSVLLYTERAHHFKRYHLKGVTRVILYGLPENPIFYREIVGGFLGASIATAALDAQETSMRALFSKLDALKLERIVGTRRYLSMLKAQGGDTFDFI